jgi:hypothetical protein
MPKKKLTKAQVKKKLSRIVDLNYDLTLDKMGHANSDVPMSLNKLLDLHKELRRAAIRIK